MIRNSYTGSKTRKITRHDKSIGFCIQESFISKMLKRVLKSTFKIIKKCLINANNVVFCG